MSRAGSACFLPGIIVSRCGLKESATDLVAASGLPFATMIMDKSVLDETHPDYIGIYDGRFMNEEVREFVEGCDCVIEIGVLMTDLSSGGFTARIDPAKSINILLHHVRVGYAVYNNVEIRDVLTALAGRLVHRQGDHLRRARRSHPKGGGVRQRGLHRGRHGHGRGAAPAPEIQKRLVKRRDRISRGSRAKRYPISWG